VQQEPAQEFVDRQRHQTLLVFVSGIAPAKRDPAAGKCHESMVRDGHAMGVLAEIAKRMLRASEGALRVNHPFGAEQRPKPRREGLRILQRGECAVEAEFVLRVQFLEAIHELAAENIFENFDRQKELLLRVDPARVVRNPTRTLRVSRHRELHEAAVKRLADAAKEGGAARNRRVRDPRR
jgi:hypothetical protein